MSELSMSNVIITGLPAMQRYVTVTALTAVVSSAVHLTGASHGSGGLIEVRDVPGVPSLTTSAFGSTS
jgi:hypothetical protein